MYFLFRAQLCFFIYQKHTQYKHRQIKRIQNYKGVINNKKPSTRFQFIILNLPLQFTFFQIFLLFFNINKYKQMSTMAKKKHALKTLSVLIQPELEKQKEQKAMHFQAHSQKMDLTTAQQNELYQKVLKFLQEFLIKKTLYAEMFEVLNKKKSLKKSQSQKQNEKILSFKKMNMGSRVCFDAEVTRKEVRQQTKYEGRVLRGNLKKISIFVMEQDFSSSSEDFSDQLISENSIKTIRSIEIPQMQMNLNSISLIYESPQPFLINLSLCLFIRYTFWTKRKVKFEQSAWVLTVATIIAYKLYYDEEIQGLIDCFTGIMKIKRKDLIDLQRCFFEEIDYTTVIMNYDYHFVLSKLLSMQIQEQKQ